MKKLISLLVPFLLIVNVTFAKGFFSHRFFEIRTDIPVGISNNALSLTDIMQKELVIDLAKIADGLPKDGFTAVVKTKPSIAMNLNILKFSMGVNVGVDAYMKFNISKDLFNLLGHGYQMGSTVNVQLKPIVDLFAFAEVPIGLSFSKFKVQVSPNVFMPVAVVDNCNTSISGYNDASGKLIAKFNNDMNIYTSPLFEMLMNQKQSSENSSESSTSTLSLANINLMNYLGFDLGAKVQLDFTKSLGFVVDAKIPIVPGRLDKKINLKNSFELDTSIMDMGSAKQTNNTEKSISTLTTPYYINRPFKIHGYVNYTPIGLINIVAGGGVGIRHPFTNSFYVYPEYYVGLGLNVIDLFKTTLSTEYTDQMFIHRLELVLNLRIIEIDAGISLQSASFVSSFKGDGFGAHVGFALGF